MIKDCAGVIIPDGFGSSGLEGIIAVIRHCRENKVKMFCYGLGM